MKYLQKTTMVLSILVILFGFYQLNSEQDIFAQSRAHCCNSSQCFRANCGEPSSINMMPFCDFYMLTCKDCLDLEYSNCLLDCGGDNNRYCLNNGQKYYGTKVICVNQ